MWKAKRMVAIRGVSRHRNLTVGECWRIGRMGLAPA